MHIETTYILKAEEGKILQNKNTKQQTPSVWLRIGESQEDWEEIEMPKSEPEEEPKEENE